MPYPLPCAIHKARTVVSLLGKCASFKDRRERQVLFSVAALRER